MKNKLFNVLVIILLIFSSIIIVDKNINSINYSLITIGNKIIDEGIFTTEDFAWVQNLEYENINWFLDIIIAKIYNIYNFYGIYVFYIILNIIIGYSLFFVINKESKNKYISLFLTLITIFLNKNILNNCIQSTTILIFIWIIYFINRLMKTRKKRYIIYICLFTILITNINAKIYPIIFLLFLPYIIKFLYNKIKLFKNNEKILIKDIDIYTILITIFLVFVFGAVNPLSWSPYMYFFRSKNFYNFDIIYRLGLLNSFSICIATFFIILIVVIFCKEKLQSIIFKFNNYIKGSTIIAISVIIISIGIMAAKNKYAKEFVNTEENPIYAADYIIENLDLKSLKIYNDYDIGDYLEFRKIPVLLDSRIELYSNRFNNTAIFYDWYNVHTGNVNFDEMFYDYGINYALLKKYDLVCNYIIDNDNWKLIYEDKNFVIYERVNI